MSSFFNLKNMFVAAQALNAGAQAYSAYSGYKSQKKEAKLVEHRAQLQAGEKRRETKRLLSTLKTQYTAAGIALDGSDTVSAILSEAEATGEADATAILNLGYEESKALKSGAKGTAIGGGLAVGASLFGGYADYKIAEKRGWF